MGDVGGFVGAPLCKMPLGIDQCYSGSGRVVLGYFAFIAMLGVIAFFFLMR
jgi:hypothetical protein